MQTFSKEVYIERLRSIREACGVTQWEISKAVGCERSTYSYYESGKTEPDVETLCRMAKLYRTTVDSLLGSISIEGASDGEIDTVETIGEKFKTLTKEERMLLFSYRVASAERQKEIREMCYTTGADSDLEKEDDDAPAKNSAFYITEE